MPRRDADVIAGQGTATLDLLTGVPSIDLMVAPVSGGGLLSGTAVAAHGLNPEIRVRGTEPETVDDAHRSLQSGHLTQAGNSVSIADGLLAVQSERTFSIPRHHDVDGVTVSEAEIIGSMALVFERLEQVIEPSAAMAVAALLALSRRGEMMPEDIGVILSGGKVDLHQLPFRPDEA